MIRSREVVPASLEHALIANRVLAALASNDLTSQESRDAFDDGLKFLKSVLKGGELANSRSIEADSYKAALAYGEGVKVFELHAYQQGQDDNPIPYLEKLRRCTSALRDHAGDDEEAVADLKTFFQTIRDVALASTERPLETVSW